MNYLDILLILPIIYGVWKGLTNGIVIEVFTFFAIFLGLYAGIHFSDIVAGFFENQVGIVSDYMPFISFVVAFLVVGAIIYFAGKAFEKIIKVARLGLLNRIGGAVFGGLKFACIVGAICVLTESYDKKTDIIADESKENSLLFMPLLEATTGLIPAFTESTIFLKNTLDNKELIQIDEQDEPQ
ncbi:MAG: membrane protein required for colicin V production [Crocinitomicaceae bacterium]|jgi:membrane protein required for colicin V production